MRSPQRWQVVLISPTYQHSSGQNLVIQFIVKSVHNALTTRYARSSNHRVEIVWRCTELHDKDGDDGVDVCLVCFNGACLGQDRHHARTHVARSGHTFALNIKRKPKPKPNSRVRPIRHVCATSTDYYQGDDEPPAKITKLIIAQEREEDKYDYLATLKCWKCDPMNGKAVMTGEDMVCIFRSSFI